VLEASARSPVRDGDDVDRVGRVDVAVPDLHRPVLALDMKSNLSHFVLRLARQDFDRDARDRHASSPISARK
jgi:hypothetical protein